MVMTTGSVPAGLKPAKVVGAVFTRRIGGGRKRVQLAKRRRARSVSGSRRRRR